MAKAVFLDRDGTIVEDTGYLHEREKVRFFPDVDKAIGLLNRAGFKIIIVTNQAGVARGYYTEGIVRELNRYIRESLAAQGALIDRFYYCPHHIEGIIEEYRKACDCRKPNTGMIEQAVRDFNIDLAASFVIGDQLSDIEAGRRAGCRTVLLAGSSKPVDFASPALPSYIACDLYQAVKWLLNIADRPGSM
ncbi:MAG: HAD family hydrolase [Chloroflexi bacterium]|nr:HAD family hydrolase [Chloroflexota bacterium]